jgi:hypothetical protein
MIILIALPLILLGALLVTPKGIAGLACWLLLFPIMVVVSAIAGAGALLVIAFEALTVPNYIATVKKLYI